MRIEVEFLPAEPRNDGCILMVRSQGVFVGRICSHPSSGTYRYYRTPDQHGGPFYEHRDLETLVRWVADKP